MSIQAIETTYKGCRFRSRLEARWAVFFDTARIAWQYEPQGYAVDGVPYLPDFYLPELGCYFEVRGAPLYDDALCDGFARQIGQPLVLAIGDIPAPELVSAGKFDGHRAFLPRPDDDDDQDLVWEFDNMFLRCDGCGRVRLVNQAYATMKGACCESARFEALTYAFQCARSARFEHGEAG